MMHSALLALLVSVTIPAAPAPVAPAATATVRAAHQSAVIKVWTEWDQYSRGDEANASVRTRDDGYLIVMQADVDGRVRVIFPIDPGDDDFVRGGHDVQLKGRNGKGAFYVDGPGGMGMVYAAVSPTPFRFNDFVQNDHWDYGALYDKTFDADFENGFTVLVDKMSTGHFDYDVYRYEVIAHTSYAENGGGGYAGPPVYAGSPCWATPYNPSGCFGPNYIPGGYLYGGGPWGYGYAPYYPGFYASYGFGVGFGFGFGFGFGYGYGYPYYGGCCYYGGGYPYYGYPYYGYGYGHYGYPYYGSHPGYYPPGYTGKPSNPGGGGGTGIGYRPRVPVGPAGGLGTPFRGTGTPARPVGGLGPPATIAHRSPNGRTGWTLGRPGARTNPNMDPRSGEGFTGRRGTGATPSSSTPHASPPPRYNPGSESGRTGGGYGGGAGMAPAAKGPSGSGPAAAPRSGGNPPSGHPATAPAPRGSGKPQSHSSAAPPERYSAPRGGSYSAQMAGRYAPRESSRYSGVSGGRYSAPMSRSFAGPAARSYSAPAAAHYSAPASHGGGGGGGRRP